MRGKQPGLTDRQRFGRKLPLIGRIDAHIGHSRPSRQRASMPPEPTPRKVQKKARMRRGFKAKKALEYGSPPLGNEPDLNAGRRTGWGMARAGISMNQAPERQHLAQVDRHIVDLKAHIVRQRVILKHTRDTGQRSEIAESLLDALEGSLRIFEKHRELILAQLQRQPYTVGESAASS
jgi:hypothetical protein